MFLREKIRRWCIEALDTCKNRSNSHWIHTVNTLKKYMKYVKVSRSFHNLGTLPILNLSICSIFWLKTARRWTSNLLYEDGAIVANRKTVSSISRLWVAITPNRSTFPLFKRLNAKHGWFCWYFLKITPKLISWLLCLTNQ